MKCGVLWYVHIAKTGGRDFVTQLKAATTQVLGKEQGGFESVRQLRGDWTLAELWYDRNMGKDHPLRTSRYNSTVAWQAIERQITGVKPPRIIVHDHNNMIGFDDQYFFDGVLRPMACYLESRGCKFHLATILREPVARAKSHIFFEGNISHSNFQERLESISNYQTHYLLHNHNFHRIRKVNDYDEDRASEIVSHFDLVGQTESQNRFKELVYQMLGWAKPTEKGVDSNRTPEGQKLVLTAAEEEYAQFLNAHDADLYKGFCAADEAAPRRREVKPLCDRGVFSSKMSRKS